MTIKKFILPDWHLPKIGVLLRIFSIAWNCIRNWLIKALTEDNNCVRLEFIDDKLDVQTNSLIFKLFIVNNSTDQIKLKKLFLKVGKENKIVDILVAHPTNNPNEEPVRWKPFEETYLMNKVLYGVNSFGSRKIDNAEYFEELELSISGLKNVAIPIPKCKTEDVKDVDGVEIALEYLITQKQKKKGNVATATRFLSLE